MNVNLKSLELDKPYTGDFLNISYYIAYEVAALSTNHAGQSTTSEVKFWSYKLWGTLPGVFICFNSDDILL